ncbi:uncharacterized [Tachysurus ichikawai]
MRLSVRKKVSKRGREDWGCNKAEKEERHKRVGAEGGQAHHMLSAAFKDGWDRWQLQTISLRRAASSQEEIRDPFVHPFPQPCCVSSVSPAQCCAVLTPLKCLE